MVRGTPDVAERPRHARVAGLVVTAVLVLFPTPTSAEPPTAIDTSPVIDRVGVVGDPSSAEGAIDQLRDETGVDLFVVYVSTFDGLPGWAWAGESARLSGLEGDQVLLAVAVDDRRFGPWAGADVPIAQDDLRVLVAESMRPRLSERDWGGAAREATRAICVELDGSCPTGAGGDAPDDQDEEDADTGPKALLVGGVALVVGLGLGAAVAATIGRRRRGTGGDAGFADPTERSTELSVPVGPPAGGPTAPDPAGEAETDRPGDGGHP